MVDGNIIRKIIAAINPQKDETLIEIGPGQGALTKHLLETGTTVLAIEKDTRMDEPLSELSKNNENRLTVNFADAMKVNFDEVAPYSPIKLVGNLPYNVGTQIVMKALETPNKFSYLTFMLQKEVVERIVATPDTSDWGRLAVWCDLLCERKKLFDVPPTAFFPKPKVTSAIVQLIPLDQPRFDVDNKALSHLLKATFGKRRKMLRASLKGMLTEKQIESCGIYPTARPETLSTEDFCKLTRKLT